MTSTTAPMACVKPQPDIRPPWLRVGWLQVLVESGISTSTLELQRLRQEADAEALEADR